MIYEYEENLELLLKIIEEEELEKIQEEWAHNPLV